MSLILFFSEFEIIFYFVTDCNKRIRHLYHRKHSEISFKSFFLQCNVHYKSDSIIVPQISISAGLFAYHVYIRCELFASNRLVTLGHKSDLSTDGTTLHCHLLMQAFITAAILNFKLGSIIFFVFLYCTVFNYVFFIVLI